MIPQSRRRSVLFVLPTLHAGGAERVVLTLLRHLDRNRFVPTLAVLDTRQAAYREDVPTDVEFVDLGCRRVRYSTPAIARLIWRSRPDVVFSAIAHLNLGIALIRPFLPLGTLLIARESAVLSDTHQGRRSAPIWAAAIRWLYRRFDSVVCQTEAMRYELVTHFGLPSSKCVVIRNPLDAARVQDLAERPLPENARLGQPPRAGEIRVVAAGRLSREKGFDLAIGALADRRNAHVHLTILGDGPLLDSLRRQATDLNVSERVQFMGFQPNPYPFLAAADAFVLSSRSEAFPNVVLEAMTCGTPIVAVPSSGGVLELLDGRPRVYLAKEVSADALASALTALAVDRSAERPVYVLDEYAVARVSAQYAALFADRS